MKPSLESLTLKKSKPKPPTLEVVKKQEEKVQVTLRVPKGVRRELRRLSFETEQTQSDLFAEAVALLSKQYQ